MIYYVYNVLNYFDGHYNPMRDQIGGGGGGGVVKIYYNLHMTTENIKDTCRHLVYILRSS